MATVVALGRLGVPLGRGIGVAVQLFVLDLTFFAWSVPLGLAYLVYAEKFSLSPSTTVAALTTAALTLAGAGVLIRYPLACCGRTALAEALRLPDTPERQRLLSQHEGAPEC